MLLSACLRRPVRCDGRRIGRLDDVGVAAGAGEPVVAGVVVGRHGHPPAWVPWSAVDELGPAGVELAAWEPSAVPTGVLLGRDVLDAQLLDIAGRRVVRVGDVDLEPPPDGAGLVVTGVEAGLDSVARRLGLRRAAAHLPVLSVPWRDLHLPAHPGATLTIDTARPALARLSGAEHRRLAARLPAHAVAGLLRAPRDRVPRRFPTHILRRRRARP